MNKIQKIAGIIIATVMISSLIYYAHWYSHTEWDAGKNFTNDRNWGAGTALLFNLVWVPVILGIISVLIVVFEKSNAVCQHKTLEQIDRWAYRCVVCGQRAVLDLEYAEKLFSPNYDKGDAELLDKDIVLGMVIGFCVIGLPPIILMFIFNQVIIAIVYGIISMVGLGILVPVITRRLENTKETGVI